MHDQMCLHKLQNSKVVNCCVQLELYIKWLERIIVEFEFACQWLFLSSGNVHRSRFQQSQLRSISRCQFPKAIYHMIYFTSTDTRSNDLTKLFLRQKPFPVSNRRQEDTSPPLFLQRTANQTYIYEITRVSYHNKLSE